MRNRPSLELLKQALRANVCPHCPYRSATADCRTAQPCEPACPIFMHLPQIKAVAGGVDPMIASRPRALRSLLGRIRALHAERQAGQSPGEAARGRPDAPSVVRRCGGRVIQVVDRMMGT